MTDANPRSEPDQASLPEYDALISYAGEDHSWCETFADRLRNENVRVWFAPWQLQPGDHLLARLNGLKNSRKTIAVWSKNYFDDEKTWTLAESFAQF